MSIQPQTRRRRPILTLGRVRGVPIQVAPSWLFIGLLLTAVYGPIVHDAVGGISSGTAYLAAFGFACCSPCASWPTSSATRW